MPGAKKSATKNAPTAPVNKVLKTKWEKAIATYRGARDAESSGWDDRYEALGDIIEAEPPLYLAGGYSTIKAFLAAEAPGETERSVRRAVRVARHFDPADEAKHGVAKLEALLDYLAAHGGESKVPAKLDLSKQRVRLPQGKSYQMRPFAELTLAELRRAARSKAGAGADDRANASPEVKRWKAVLVKAKLAQVAVSMRGGLLTFSGIAPELVKKVGAVLGKA